VHGLRVQGAGHATACKGAGLLHTEPEEGGVVGRRELKADAAIDHRYRFRVHGEGCEGMQVGGFDEGDLYLHVARLIEPHGVIR